MLKKMAILIYSLEGDGAERVVSILLNELKSDYEITLVLMHERIDYEIPKEIEVVLLDQGEYQESGVTKLAKLPFLGYSYKEFCKEYEIDISLSFMNRPNYINLLAKSYGNDPLCIVSERIAPSKEYFLGSLKDRVSRYLIKRLYPKADLILPNSQGIKADLIENFSVPSKLIEVVNNPIDLTKIEYLKNEPSRFPFSSFTFINIGRLHPQKNQKMLIEAFYRLNDPHAKLIIIGEGELKEELENLIEDLNLGENVFLLGRQSNPFSYLSKADVFVLGSDYEGFPNVVLEALACEVPVISTDCKSGPREILSSQSGTHFELQQGVEYAKYGVLVPVNNPVAMSEAMEKMMRDERLRQKYKKMGSFRVKDFEKEKIVLVYKDKIEAALAKRKGFACVQ